MSKKPPDKPLPAKTSAVATTKGPAKGELAPEIRQMKMSGQHTLWPDQVLNLVSLVQPLLLLFVAVLMTAMMVPPSAVRAWATGDPNSTPQPPLIPPKDVPPPATPVTGSQTGTTEKPLTKKEFEDALKSLTSELAKQTKSVAEDAARKTVEDQAASVLKELKKVETRIDNLIDKLSKQQFDKDGNPVPAASAGSAMTEAQFKLALSAELGPFETKLKDLIEAKLKILEKYLTTIEFNKRLDMLADKENAKRIATDLESLGKFVKPAKVDDDSPFTKQLAIDLGGILKNSFTDRLDNHENQLNKIITALHTLENSQRHTNSYERVAVIACNSQKLEWSVYRPIMEPLKTLPFRLSNRNYQWGIYTAGNVAVDGEHPVMRFGQHDEDWKWPSSPGQHPMTFDQLQPQSLFNEASPPQKERVLQRCILLLEADENPPAIDNGNWKSLTVDAIVLQTDKKASDDETGKAWSKWNAFCAAHDGEAILVRIKQVADANRPSQSLMDDESAKAVRLRLLRLLQPRVSPVVGQ